MNDASLCIFSTHMNAQFSLSQYGPEWLRQSISIIENDKYQIYYDKTSQNNEMFMTIGIYISSYQTHEIKSYEYILFEAMFRQCFYNPTHNFYKCLIRNNVNFERFQIKDDFLQLTLRLNSPEQSIIKQVLQNLLQIIYKPQISKMTQTQLQQLLEFHINDYYDILAYSQIRTKTYKEINIDLQNIQNANNQISKMVTTFHKQNIEKSPFVLFISAPDANFQEEIIEICEDHTTIYGIKPFTQNIYIQPTMSQMISKDVKMFLTHDIKQNNQLCTLSVYGIGAGSILNVFANELQQFILEWIISYDGPIVNLINKIYCLESENSQNMHQVTLQTNFLEKCLHYKITIQNVNGIFSERLLWELQNFLTKDIYQYVQHLEKQQLHNIVKSSQRNIKRNGLHTQIINDVLKFSLLKRSNQLYITPVDIYGPIHLYDSGLLHQCLEKHLFMQIYDYWSPFSINQNSNDKYDQNMQNAFINNKILFLHQYLQDLNIIMPHIQTIEIVSPQQTDFNLHLLQGNQNVFIGNQNKYNKIVHSVMSIGSKQRIQQIILHLTNDIKMFFNTAIKSLMSPQNLIIQLIAGWKYNPKVQAMKLLRQRSNSKDQITESTMLSDEQQQPQIQQIQENSRVLAKLLLLYQDEQNKIDNINIIHTNSLRKLFAQTNFQTFSGTDSNQQEQIASEQSDPGDTSFNNGVNLQQVVLENKEKNIQFEWQISNEKTGDGEMQYQQIYSTAESQLQIKGKIIQYKVPNVLNNLFINILQNQQLQDYFINYDQYTNNDLITYIIVYLQQGIEYQSDQHLLSQFKSLLKNANVNYSKLISNITIEITVELIMNLEKIALPLEFYQYINYLVIIYNKIHSQIQFQYEDNQLQIRINAISIEEIQDLFKFLINKYVHKKIMYDDLYIMAFTNLNIGNTLMIIQTLHDYIWVNNITLLKHDIKFFNCSLTLLPQHASYQQQYNKLMQQICYNCYQYLLKLFDIIVKKFSINNESSLDNYNPQDKIKIIDVCDRNMILEVKECIANDIGIFILTLNDNLNEIQKKIAKYYYQSILQQQQSIDKLTILQVTPKVLYIIFRAAQQSIAPIFKLINLQEQIQELQLIQYLEIYQKLNQKLEYPVIFIQTALKQLQIHQSDIRCIIITRQKQKDQYELMKKQKGQYESFLEQKKALQDALSVTDEIYKAILSSGDILQYLQIYKDRVIYDQNFNVSEQLEKLKLIINQRWLSQQKQQVNNVQQQIIKQKQGILLKNQTISSLEHKMEKYDQKYMNKSYKQIPLQVAYSSVIVTQMIQKQQFNLEQQQQLQQLHIIQDEQKKKQGMDFIFNVQPQIYLSISKIQQKINNDLESKIKFIKSFQLDLFKTLKKMFTITENGQINGYAIQPFHHSQKVVFKTVPQINLSHGYIYQKQDTLEENDEFFSYQEMQKLIKQDKIFQIETALYNACQLIEYLRIIGEVQLPNPINLSGMHTSFIHLSTKHTLQPLSIDIVNGACEYSLQNDQKPKIRILKGQSMFQSNAPIGNVIPISRDILPDADKYNVCIRLLAEDIAKLAEHFEVRITKSNLILSLNEILNQQIKRLSVNQ